MICLNSHPDVVVHISIPRFTFFLFKQITPGSIAELVGLRLRDTIFKINNEPSGDITNADAEASVHKGGNNFALVIQR